MDEINNILNAAGAQAVNELKQLIKSKAVAGGDLLNSIGYEINNGVLRITGAPHLHYALYGRRPGKGPPRKAIELWIDDKGIVAEVSKQSLAYLIQRKIAAEGTTGILSASTAVVPAKTVAGIKVQLNTFFKNSIKQQMQNALKNK